MEQYLSTCDQSLFSSDFVDWLEENITFEVSHKTSQQRPYKLFMSLHNSRTNQKDKINTVLHSKSTKLTHSVTF
jgi:hypothetical protein